MRYYTSQVSQIPLTLLWKIIWRTWRFGPLLAPFFAFQKIVRSLLRIKLKVQHALPYPETLYTMEVNELPRAVQQDLEKHITELNDLSFQLAMCVDAQYLGRIEQYTVYFLSEDG